MLKCFEAGTLVIDVPQDPSEIGYSLSGNCDWEEEHGKEIAVLDDRLVYLGGILRCFCLGRSFRGSMERCSFRQSGIRLIMIHEGMK